MIKRIFFIFLSIFFLSSSLSLHAASSRSNKAIKRWLIDIIDKDGAFIGLINVAILGAETDLPKLIEFFCVVNGTDNKYNSYELDFKDVYSFKVKYRSSPDRRFAMNEFKIAIKEDGFYNSDDVGRRKVKPMFKDLKEFPESIIIRNNGAAEFETSKGKYSLPAMDTQAVSPEEFRTLEDENNTLNIRFPDVKSNEISSSKKREELITAFVKTFKLYNLDFKALKRAAKMPANSEKDSKFVYEPDHFQCDDLLTKPIGSKD